MMLSGKTLAILNVLNIILFAAHFTKFFVKYSDVKTKYGRVRLHKRGAISCEGLCLVIFICLCIICSVSGLVGIII